MDHDISAVVPGEGDRLAEPATERDHRQGSLLAQVVLVEYGDYQCPQCRELYALIKTLQAQISSTSFQDKDLCFVFRHFPQPQLYPQTQKAAAAAEAAGTQGLFWQMSELLWEHHQALGDGYLVEYAYTLGLDVAQFLRDIARGVHLDRIQQDIETGRQSGVTHPPALFINGERYRGPLALEPLLAAIVASGSPS